MRRLMKPRNKWWIPVSVMAVFLWMVLHFTEICNAPGWDRADLTCGGHSWLLLVTCFFLVWFPFSVGRFFQHEVDQGLLNEITPGLGEVIKKGWR